ncbi:MAG: helix-turn-helix domain-containing protein [Fluviicola sp.]
MTNSEYLQRLATKIKTIRKEKGLTQAQLAEALGTNHTYIVRMERGDQDSRITSLVALANALGIGIGELVSV